MTIVGQPERATQQRVVALFRDELGYRYLGDWTDRDGNSNVKEELLSAYLCRRGYTPAQIGKAIHALRTEADNHARSLYANNKAVYELLRCRWAAKQTPADQPDGSVILEMETSGRWDVKRWVLAFGADAEVLEPEDLRQEIAADLRGMLSAYSRE